MDTGKRTAPWFVLAALLAFGLAGCGDTWRGVKKDTGENLQTVGGAVEGAGENVEESAEPAQ